MTNPVSIGVNKDNENLNQVLNQIPSINAYASKIFHFDSITIDDLH